MSGDAAHRPASRATLLALTLGHGCADLCSGALFALLPFLVVERNYSYAAAGVFALTTSLARRVSAPHRRPRGRGEAHRLLPTGLVLTGLGMGAAGLVASYPLPLIAVAVCSAGAAGYDPEGARWARQASSSRVTADMSVFSVGGGVGYAVGPLVVAAVLAPLGLHGTLVIALIPIAAASAASSWPRSACSATPWGRAQCSMRSRRCRSSSPCSPPGYRGLRPPRPEPCGACASKPGAVGVDRVPDRLGATSVACLRHIERHVVPHIGAVTLQLRWISQW